MLNQLEQLWQIPVNLSARGQRWADLWWGLNRLRVRRGTVQHYVGEYAGAAIRVVTVGRTKHALPFCEDVLGDLKFAGRTQRSSLSTPHDLGRLTGDLVVTEIHPRQADAFRKANWLVFPGWVRWRADLRQAATQPPRSLKSDLNKVQTYGYECKRSFQSRDWQEFWCTMVEPYAAARFAEWAWVPSWALRRIFEHFGALHFVYRGRRRVAGFAALCARGRGWFPVLGVLPEPELRQQGIVAAIYRFTFDWARDQGLTSIDLGRSEAFLNDGIGQYKRKWGLEPVVDPMSHLLSVKVGPVVEAAFAEEPLRVLTLSGLETYAGQRDRLSLRQNAGIDAGIRSNARGQPL